MLDPDDLYSGYDYNAAMDTSAMDDDIHFQQAIKNTMGKRPTVNMNCTMHLAYWYDIQNKSQTVARVQRILDPHSLVSNGTRCQTSLCSRLMLEWNICRSMRYACTTFMSLQGARTYTTAPKSCSRKITCVLSFNVLLISRSTCPSESSDRSRPRAPGIACFYTWTVKSGNFSLLERA